MLSNCKKRWPKKKPCCDCTQFKAKLPNEYICISKRKRANVHFVFINAYNSCKWYLHILFPTHFHYEHQFVQDDWGNNADWFKWRAGLQKCMREKQICTKSKGHADVKSISKRLFLVRARDHYCSICCPVLIRTILEFVTNDSLSYRPRHVECVAARRKNIFF